MGIGDGPGSVDTRVLLTPGGDLCWMTDDTLIAQTRADGYRVVQMPLSGLPRITLAGAANALCAGGGRWLGWASDIGLFGSLGSKPQAGLVAAGPDGTLAYCPDYQTGLGLVLSGPDGWEQVIADAQVVDRQCQVLGPLRAIWLDARGGVRAYGLPDPIPALRPGRMRLVVVDGVRWLVYWAEGTGLVAQVDGASDGYILEQRPIAFNHDAVANGQLVVAWSTTQGEMPDDLVTVTVDRAAPRVRLVAPLPVPAPPPPVPEPAPPPQEPMMPDTLRAGDTLRRDDSLVSADHRFRVVMQGDGNLVGSRQDGTPRWATGTEGYPDAWAVMQGDGNLVVYADDGTPLWASHTEGHDGAAAVIQSDGNFVIYRDGTPLWASGTVDEAAPVPSPQPGPPTPHPSPASGDLTSWPRRGATIAASLVDTRWDYVRWAEMLGSVFGGRGLTLVNVLSAPWPEMEPHMELPFVR